MTEKLTLDLNKRTLSGRKVKQLRRQHIIPANIFGKKISSIPVQISLKDFQKIYEKAGETSIIYATVNSEKEVRPLLVSALQVNPITDLPIHVDFHQVDLTQKVTATVPLVLTGTAPAVEDKGAVLIQMINELDVEALPTEIPHELTLDISSLKEIGDSLSVEDLKIDTSKIKIQAEPDEQIVQAQEPQIEEEPTPAPEGETSTEEGKTEQAQPETESEEAK